nr:unnamed protein product [Callosobruchus chinensis]
MIDTPPPRHLNMFLPRENRAEEAEEVGVEHLLRDIKDTTVGTLSQTITNQLLGLKGLHSQLRKIREYLIHVHSCPTQSNEQQAVKLRRARRKRRKKKRPGRKKRTQKKMVIRKRRRNEEEQCALTFSGR